MKKMASYFICIAVIFFVTVFILYASARDGEKNTEFLNSYGWKTDEIVIEREEVVIPEKFDDVYYNYEFLQNEAGLSLEKYCGKKCVRYTYRVTNYPFETDGEVRANVICYKGKAIAGDIMTVKIDGFMHSLIYPEK